MKFVLFVTSAVSTILASNITLSPINNSMGGFKKSEVIVEDDSVRISSRIVLKRGLEDRHISVITFDDQGKKLNNFCEEYYIPGDNHVHKGTSKKGKFSIAIPTDESIEKITLEFSNQKDCK